MTHEYTDESRIWVLFDTSTHIDYYLDVHGALAAPSQWVIRYAYQSKHVDVDVLNAMTSGLRVHPRDVLIIYCQPQTYKRGDQTPESCVPFTDMLWIPIRVGRMLHVMEDAGRYYFYFAVSTYPAVSPEVQTLCHDLYQRGCTPFSKWVAFHSLHSSRLSHRADTPSANWRRIVDELSSPPSQFAGDLFWRVIGLNRKRWGVNTSVSIAQQWHRENRQIRHVSSYFSTIDSSHHTAEIAAILSPHPRVAGAKTNWEIQARSDNENILRVEGPGVLRPRRYTNEQLNLKTHFLTYPESVNAVLTLNAMPDEGGYPQGPKLELRISVRKNLLSFGCAITGITGAVLIFTPAIREALAVPGTLGDALYLALGVVLGIFGLTVLTGKTSFKW